MIQQIASSPLLVVVIGVAIASVAQAVADPRVAPAFLPHRLVTLVAYAVHAVASIALLVFVVPPHAAPWSLGVALAGWLGLGLLIVQRRAPDAQTRPAWLIRFGWLDLACLVLIAVGLAVATGLF